jgi:hypothetical protein
MALGGIWFEAQHLAEFRNSLIDSLQIQQSESHADVRFSIVRIEPEQFTEFFHALAVVPLLDQGNTQVAARGGNLWVQLEGSLKMRNRLIVLPDFVQ